jgi:hypothetical protein
MSKDHYEDKYTDPELRRQIKEELLNSDKGGEPGQWSARKSQMLVREYEKRGGSYKTSERDEAAKSLEEWTEQDWQTEEGDGSYGVARSAKRARDGNVTKRYLPKAVWDKLSDAEKEEAERLFLEASKRGKQHVEWTPATKQAMHEYEQEFEHQHEHDRASDSELTKEELYEQAKNLHVPGRSKMNREELLEAIKAKRNSEENE